MAVSLSGQKQVMPPLCLPWVALSSSRSMQVGRGHVKPEPSQLLDLSP